MNDPASTHRETALLAADAQGIARAVALLRAGQLVAFPTETVYGLGADAGDARAVAGIYAAKERPRFNPLIAHVADRAGAERIGRLNADALRLADAFWPGPLTLVVPYAGDGVCDLARAGNDSVALRVPAHPAATALLAAFGGALAAPSANRSGRVSPTLAEHVLADLNGRIHGVIDGGPARVGLESTIVACLDGSPRLLRPGGLPREAIEACLGRKLADASAPEDGAPLAPGMLASHYAPRAAVRIDAREVRAGEAWLGFGGMRPGGAAVTALDLSPSGDIAEAAANLFGYLRRLDASGAATIAVAPVPFEGLGEAINDRLARAAAER